MKLEAIWWDKNTLLRPQISVWWDNFRKGTEFRGPEERAERLAEWGAVWVFYDLPAKSSRCLEFENDADAIAFILKWS